MGRFPNTKLRKAMYLSEDSELRQYNPQTELAMPETVLSMLKQYRMVYVKPNLGTGGHGVIKAEQIKIGGTTKYRYKLDMRTYTFTSYEEFYRSLSRHFGPKVYLVQQGIKMLTSGGKPFDLRVMIQKNERGRWEHTGSIGRIAHPRRIVTNYHSGGTPQLIEKLLRPYMGTKGSAAYNRRLGRLGLQVARYMQKGYPNIKDIGLDIGIDKSKKPWIFEVNTRPNPIIFRSLNQPAVYKRIKRLTRLHGEYHG
ncbi:YheC/YheD family protein [Paenibacillus eucommiae]|uniref:YheC/YheD family protein n=1 Tax=Paenibacillus eucommiae TaxID=1355755 RepID=A0ABS4ITY1_9BACL|nr:YheC/YheD family protein [Paenibacillus eucommiae]MBP1990481.1 hypothetical protein [Paenibacillus eucommiae]